MHVNVTEVYGAASVHELPAPTVDPVLGQADQFYLSSRQDLVRDVRRAVR